MRRSRIVHELVRKIGMKFRMLSVLGLCLGLTTFGWSQAPNLDKMDIVVKSVPDGPVARVGDTNIGKLDFLLLYQSELRAFVTDNPGRVLEDGNRIRIALVCINILLEQELLYQEALKFELKPDAARINEGAAAQFDRLQKGFSSQAGRELTEPEVLERLGYTSKDDIKREVERVFLVGAMRDKIVDEQAEELPQATLEEIYEKDKSMLTRPTRLHVKHISIKGDKSDNASYTAGLAKANKALDSIYSGQSFENVAQEYSELLDPKNGSDLGLVPADVLPAFFVKAAVNMELGDISEIIESPTGLHIIELVAREDGGEIPKEKAMEIIRANLTQRQSRLVVRTYCDRLMLDGAKVKVFLELEENLARMSDPRDADSE